MLRFRKSVTLRYHRVEEIDYQVLVEVRDEAYLYQFLTGNDPFSY